MFLHTEFPSVHTMGAMVSDSGDWELDPWTGMAGNIPFSQPQ